MAKLFQKMIAEQTENEKTLITIRNVRLFALFLCLVSTLIALFFIDFFVFAKGIILGGAAAQLIFRQHEIAVKKTFSGDSQKVTALNYFIRLFIRAAVIIVACVVPDISIIGCVLGLLSISYAIMLLAYIDKLVFGRTGKEE